MHNLHDKIFQAKQRINKNRKRYERKAVFNGNHHIKAERHYGSGCLLVNTVDFPLEPSTDYFSTALVERKFDLDQLKQNIYNMMLGSV